MSLDTSLAFALYGLAGGVVRIGHCYRTGPARLSIIATSPSPTTRCWSTIRDAFGACETPWRAHWVVTAIGYWTLGARVGRISTYMENAWRSLASSLPRP